MHCIGHFARTLKCMMSLMPRLRQILKADSSSASLFIDVANYCAPLGVSLASLYPSCPRQTGIRKLFSTYFLLVPHILLSIPPRSVLPQIQNTQAMGMLFTNATGQFMAV